jgi:hypothetical protein
MVLPPFDPPIYQAPGGILYLDNLLRAFQYCKRKLKMAQIKDFMYDTGTDLTGREFKTSQKTFLFSDPMILSTSAMTLEFQYF